MSHRVCQSLPMVEGGDQQCSRSGFRGLGPQLRQDAYSVCCEAQCVSDIRYDVGRSGCEPSQSAFDPVRSWRRNMRATGCAAIMSSMPQMLTSMPAALYRRGSSPVGLVGEEGFVYCILGLRRGEERRRRKGGRGERTKCLPWRPERVF
jgi:hypothetical protein